MRWFGVIGLLLWSNWGWGQVVIRGVTADYQTRQVLPLVHLFIKDTVNKTFQGTISGPEGRFSLPLPGDKRGDSLTFSCLGYQNIKRSVTSLLKGDTVFLREAPVYLATVTVSPVSAAELIRTCIDRIPENYRNTGFINTSFVWQGIETDGMYESFRESVATLHETHTRTTSDYKLLKDSVLNNLPGQAVNIIQPLDSIYKLLYFDFARTGSGILNAGTLHEWSIRYDYDAGAPDSYWVIDAERKDHLQHARIFINPDDYAFKKIAFGYRWRNPVHNRLNDTVYYALNSVNGTLLYEKTGQHYGIKYITLQARYTTGSTVLLKAREPSQSNTATLEYIVLKSREIPVSQKPVMPFGSTPSQRPVPVDQETYQQIRNAVQRLREANE